MLILLLLIVFIHSCPPNRKPEPSQKNPAKESTDDENPSRSEVPGTQPKTIAPDVLRRKEFMLAPIKGTWIAMLSMLRKYNFFSPVVNGFYLNDTNKSKRPRFIRRARFII